MLARPLPYLLFQILLCPPLLLWTEIERQISASHIQPRTLEGYERHLRFSTNQGYLDVLETGPGERVPSPVPSGGGSNATSPAGTGAGVLAAAAAPESDAATVEWLRRYFRLRDGKLSRYLCKEDADRDGNGAGGGGGGYPPWLWLRHGHNDTWFFSQSLTPEAQVGATISIDECSFLQQADCALERGAVQECHQDRNHCQNQQDEHRIAVECSRDSFVLKISWIDAQDKPNHHHDNYLKVCEKLEHVGYEVRIWPVHCREPPNNQVVSYQGKTLWASDPQQTLLVAILSLETR